MDKKVEEILKRIPDDEVILKQCSENISKWAKRLRQNSSVKQADLAEKVGISRSTIAQWESGIRIPTVAQYMLLSYLFGVAEGELLGLSDDNEIIEDGEYNYYQKIRKNLYLRIDMFNDKGRYLLEQFYYMMFNNSEFLENPNEVYDDEVVNMFED